jgi:hypothetical protein
MKNILIYLVILCTGSLLGCKRDKVELIPFDKMSYPLNVDNWWSYKVTNLKTAKIDTLFLKIVSKSVNNNIAIYKCDLKQNERVIDSAQIMLSESELSYNGLDPNYSFFGDFKLKLPFNKGNTWNGDSSLDVINVVSISADYIVLNKKYNIYDIKRSFEGFGYRINQTIQVSKGIGIVSQYIDLFDGGSVEKKQFELIDYKLN